MPDIQAAEELPASLHEVVELIGLQATLALVERWGGITQLYVPVDPGADHPLSQVVGRPAATALAERWGGDYLRSIPRCAAAVRAARDRAIMDRLDDGESPAVLALEYGLTERWVWVLKRRARNQTRQLGLL